MCCLGMKSWRERAGVRSQETLQLAQGEGKRRGDCGQEAPI